MQIAKGRFVARSAENVADRERGFDLRALVFRGNRAGADADGFDAACEHVLVKEQATGQVVACCRLLVLPDGAAVLASYSGQYYDLAKLAGLAGPKLELGRLCLHPDWHDADILRLIWGMVALRVDQLQAGWLIGCVSFAGMKAKPWLDSFALLHGNHLAPTIWRPGRKAAEAVDFATALDGHTLDPGRGLRQMPALLRSYLNMGGQVSDHAVVDRDLGTLHVFTGLEVAKIPAQRVQALRNLAWQAGGPVDAGDGAG